MHWCLAYLHLNSIEIVFNFDGRGKAEESRGEDYLARMCVREGDFTFKEKVPNRIDKEDKSEKKIGRLVNYTGFLFETSSRF